MIDQRAVLELLREARRAATLHAYGCRPWFPSDADQTVTFKNGDVSDFVREHMSLYNDSWVIGPLDEAIELLSGEKPNDR